MSITFIFTILPYLIVFHVETTFIYYVEKIIDIYFIIDIFINFNLAFMKKCG